MIPISVRCSHFICSHCHWKQLYRILDFAVEMSLRSRSPSRTGMVLVKIMMSQSYDLLKSLYNCVDVPRISLFSHIVLPFFLSLWSLYRTLSRVENRIEKIRPQACQQFTIRSAQ